MTKVSRVWIWLGVLVLAVVLVPAGRTNAQTGWRYWRQITIQSSQVAGDLTGFPVLVSLSGDWLKDTSHGGHVALANGGDILFLATDYARLDHEVEAYNGTDGTLVAWVRIPSLSASVDTEIYILYGNPDAAEQSNAAAVWDANYVMVQHLQEASGTHADSTTNGNDCAPLNGVVQGAVGILDGADDFDGNDDYLDCGIGQARGMALMDVGLDSLNPVDAITLEAWASVDVVTTGNNDHLVSREASYGLNFAQVHPQDRPRFKLFDTTGNEHNVDIKAPLNTGEWYYLVGTWVSPTMEFYLNGVVTGTVVFTGAINTTANPTLIGAWDLDSLNQAPDGRIDEVRISDIARSGEWIQTSYNNQSAPSTFSVLGPEQQPGVGLAKVQDGPPVAAGSEVTFTIAVTNTGDLDLTGLSVVDPAAPDCDRSLGGLVAGDNITYSCSVANVTAEFTNTATVSGTVSARSYVSDTASAFVDLLPGIVVTKTADPAHLIEPGGAVTFSVAVDNNSAEPLTLTSLVDSIHGDLSGQGSCLVPQSLAPDAVYGCAFTATVAGGAGYQEVDEVAASVSDDEGNSVVVSDTAVVTVHAALDILVAPTVLTVTEPASTDVFSISLTSAPTATVTVPLTVTNRQCTVTVSSAVLDGSNWSQGVAVTVAAVDDPVADGAQVCEVQTGAAESADPGYAGLDAADVTVTVLDDDDAEIEVAPTVLIVSEPSGSEVFDISLTSEPTAPVTVPLTVTNEQCTVTVSSAVLDGSNWSQGVAVTVAAVDDPVADGTQVCGVQTGAAQSADLGYAGLDAADVTVVVLDDDAPEIVVAPTLLIVSEPASTDLFEISLATEPTATVTVPLTVTNDQCTVTVSSVVLDQNNWAQGVAVTVAAVDDPIADGVQVCEVRTEAADSADPGYAGLDAADVTVIVLDDDAASIVVAPTVLTVSEPSGTEVFGISLTTEPTAMVTVPLTVTNDQCTVTVSSVVLDPSNWAQGVAVTVAAVDDAVTDGTQVCAVRTGAAQSADPGYAGLDPSDVMVIVLDDDEAGILVSPTGLEVGEPDGSALFTVTLQTEPSASVSIALSASNDECTASTMWGSEVVLDNTNWNQGVGVTVMALDDSEGDGDQTCVVQTHPAESADGRYDGIDPEDVTVIVLDDDALLGVHLPLVLRGWPPVPTLDPLPTTDCDGQYTVSWSAVQGASAYALQEAADCTFADAVQVYGGAGTSYAVTGQAVGSYCYRVRALGPGWASAWSSSQAVDVLSTPDAPLLRPIDNTDGDGSYPVRWDGVDVARTYVLTEARGDACSEPVTVYTGPATSYGIDGRGAGRLCYYVQASNDCGQSAWSDSQWVDVLWEAEPNNDMNAGANGPLVPGLVYYGALPAGDPQDYFYIDLLADGGVELWLTDIPAGHDYDLYLRNAQGTAVARSSEIGNADEHIVTGILPQGRYYIQVHHYSPGGSAQPYHLLFEYR